MNIDKVRDLTIIHINDKQSLVIACDSCGSIGMKPYDTLKIPNFYGAKFTARVVLMEVLCSGAEVISLSNAVCNEMNPTGMEMIEGIKSEMECFEINNAILTGSTEENFETFSSGLGITAIGIIDTNKLKVNNVKKDSLLISIGIPKIGGEFNLQGDDSLVSYKELKTLLNTNDVHELVPVGSKGILYEANLLAKNNNMKLILEKDIKIDIKRSCGPATVIIVALDERIYEKLKDINNINIIGKLIR